MGVRGHHGHKEDQEQKTPELHRIFGIPHRTGKVKLSGFRAAATTEIDPSIQRRAADRPHGKPDLRITAPKVRRQSQGKGSGSSSTPSGARAGLHALHPPPANRSLACILEEMIPLSVLDLSPIVQGGTPALAFRHTLELAQYAEGLGYTRFWLAEHHNMPGIGSAATAVLIGHVGAGTSRIRIGAGGIMLPNHAPLQVAEQFGTLESLFPGRIDLGLGRAPG